MANEEQGTEKTEGEGDEQDVGESPVIGLDNGSVSVFYKDPKNSSCEYREDQSHAGQSQTQGIFITQKGHRFLEAVVLVLVGILMICTLHTLIHVW
jgi:hypothetical protein